MKKKNGFTLIELTISIGLLAVVILFVVNYISIIRKNEDGLALDTRLYLNKQMISEVINEDIIKTGKVSEVAKELEDIVIYFANGEKRIISSYNDGKILVYKEEHHVLYTKESIDDYVFKKEVEDKDSAYIINIKTNDKSTYDINIVIYKDPSVAPTYAYWSQAQGGQSVHYDNSSKPSTTYTSATSLPLPNNPGAFVRTKLINNAVVKHEACIRVSGNYFCAGLDFFDTNVEKTKTKLETKMKEALGESAVGVCNTTGTTYATCNMSNYSLVEIRENYVRVKDEEYMCILSTTDVYCFLD